MKKKEREKKRGESTGKYEEAKENEQRETRRDFGMRMVHFGLPKNLKVRPGLPGLE